MEDDDSNTSEYMLSSFASTPTDAAHATPNVSDIFSSTPSPPPSPSSSMHTHSQLQQIYSRFTPTISSTPIPTARTLSQQNNENTGNTQSNQHMEPSQYDPHFISQVLHIAEGADMAEERKQQHQAQLNKTREANRARYEAQHKARTAKTTLAKKNTNVPPAITPKPNKIPPIPSKQRQRELLNIVHNPAAFKNLTNLKLPDQVKTILAFGMKFGIPINYKTKDSDQLKQAVHDLNNIYLSPQEATTLNAIAADIIQQHTDENQHDPDVQKYLTSAFYDTIRLFKETPGIMATQADKANASIVMYTQDYIEKVNNLLSDADTYKKINWSQSSIMGYRARNKALLQRLVNIGRLKPIQMRTILDEEIRHANFYSFIKTHKEGAPGRPIVNTRASPGYYLSQYLNDVLSPFIEHHKYNIKNSSELVELIRNVKPEPSEKLFSFDVKSMFTSVAPDLSIRAFQKRLQIQDSISEREKLIITDVMRFTTQYATEFTFNNGLYKQINGLRMGSACSNICSDIVIEGMLDTTFEQISKPKLFAKYIDDIICLCTPDTALAILNSLNQQNPRIQFEIEEQNENGELNYLDVTIINKGDYTLHTQWFQKPMASGRFLNYLSCHHPTTVYNTAKSFVQNMFNVSSPQFHAEIENQAKKLLALNNYPQEKINHIIDSINKNTHEPDLQQQWYNSIMNNTDSFHFDMKSNPMPPLILPKRGKKKSNTSERKYAAVTLPYFPHTTEAIIHEFNKLRPNTVVPTKPLKNMKRQLYDRLKDPAGEQDKEQEDGAEAQPKKSRWSN